MFHFNYVKLATLAEGDPKAPFSIATALRCVGGRNSFPWIVPLYFYFIMLSVKQGSIKCHFLCLWYESTWDWILISRTIGEHSTHKAKAPCGGGVMVNKLD